MCEVFETPGNNKNKIKCQSCEKEIKKEKMHILSLKESEYGVALIVVCRLCNGIIGIPKKISLYQAAYKRLMEHDLGYFSNKRWRGIEARILAGE